MVSNKKLKKNSTDSKNLTNSKNSTNAKNASGPKISTNSKSSIPVEETPILHPKSRKCKAIAKQFKKETKREKNKQETKLKQCLLSEKLLWFQKNMDPNICPYTMELTAALVEKYIERNDEELEQIKYKQSIGMNRNKQHIARENAICMTKQRERECYEGCGLEIPNILNASQYSLLKKWDGDTKFLPNFKLRNFSKRHLDEELKKKQQRELQKGSNKLMEHDCAEKVTSQSQKKSKETVSSKSSTDQAISNVNTESDVTTNQMDID